MALDKYKVCPVCGEYNPPNLLQCKNRECETDLTGIKVVDNVYGQKAHEAENQAEEQSIITPGELFRICDCKEKNPPQARKCKVCGEDISDIIPTPCEDEAKPFSYSLKAVDDGYAISIDKPVVIIGRGAELKEYLDQKNYVSRQHAKLTIVAGKVFIENLSKTNNTYINNEVIKDDNPAALEDNDEIGLGGIAISGNRQSNAAYFVFKVKL